MTPVPLTWHQVSAWRLAQHSLAPRSARGAFVAVAAQLFGVHAQVMSAATLAFGARVDGLTPMDVEAALWQDRTLVKTWAMRGTLHLLAADDLAYHVAARQCDPRHWIDLAAHGLTERQFQAFLEAVADVVGDTPMTREQLAAAVSAQLRLPILTDMIRSKWGTALKPSAFRGELCFGPSQGNLVTFVNPRKWLRTWQPPDPEEAFQEIARRFLRAYGPLAPRHFARWWNEGRVAVARKLFEHIRDELVEVDVEGWRALALRATVEPMQQAASGGVVRLLPLFDAYVLDIGRMGAPVLPDQQRKRVFRQQGWTSAVVLVDGHIHGVWASQPKGTGTALTVEMFAPPTTLVRDGIAAEAARLEAFWGAPVALHYGAIA